MSQLWTSQLTTMVLTADMAQRLCAPGARRGGVVATLARRETRAKRMVAWTGPGASGGTRPIGTFVIDWAHPEDGGATLAELSWPAAHEEAELWHAIEELAGRALPAR